jgi:F-type H+-transporting ATPase subunit delta
MSQRVIARRFAVALADSLREREALRGMEGELGNLAAALDEVPELREFLVGPLIPVEKKRAALRSVAGALGASDRCRDFSLLLLERHRIDLVAIIAEEFSTTVRERLGIVDAEIASATPLDDNMKARAREALARLSGREVRATFEVDPSLVGGLKARIGSTIYDGSVRGRLERLREQIVKE